MDIDNKVTKIFLPLLFNRQPEKNDPCFSRQGDKNKSSGNLDKSSAKGYVATGEDHVSMTYKASTICILKFTKGHNSVKNVSRVRVLVLFASSNNAVSLSQILGKYLKGFQSYRLKQ